MAWAQSHSTKSQPNPGEQMMRKKDSLQGEEKLAALRPLLLLVVAALIVATVTSVWTPRAIGRDDKGDKNEFQGRGDEDRDDHDRESYAIGLWGDLPYSDVQATIGIPNLIADMNSQQL